MFKVERFDGKGFTSVLTTHEGAKEFLIDYTLAYWSKCFEAVRSMPTGDGGWQIMWFGKKARIARMLDVAMAAWLENDIMAQP